MKQSGSGFALILNACSMNSRSPTGPGGAAGVVTVTGKVDGVFSCRLQADSFVEAKKLL